MAFKLVVLSCLLAVAYGSVVPAAITAGPVAAYAAPAVAARLEEFDPLPQYRYGYDIADSLTGDYKSQNEERNGDLVRGSYSLVEPDGTRRVVQYTADSVNGFNALVTKEPLAAGAPAVVAEPAVISARVAAAPVYTEQAIVAPARYAVAPAAAPVVARYATAPVAPAPVVARYSAAPVAASYAPVEYSARYAVAPAAAPVYAARYAAAPAPVAYASPYAAAGPYAATYTAPFATAAVTQYSSTGPLAAYSAPLSGAYAAYRVSPLTAEYAAPVAYSAQVAAPVASAGPAVRAAPTKFVDATASTAGYRYP